MPSSKRTSRNRTSNSPTLRDVECIHGDFAGIARFLRDCIRRAVPAAQGQFYHSLLVPVISEGT